MTTPTEAVIAAARALLEKSVEWQQAFPDSAVPDPVDHAAATLRAALAAYDAAPDGWMPIESAPRDGATVIVWSREGEEPRTARLLTSLEDNDEAWIIARSVGSSPVAFAYPNPTHWRPLPPPPETPHD